MAGAQRLEPREARPVSEQEAFSMAVSSKQMIDVAIRNAVDKALKDLGKEKFTCYMCGELKSREDFYPSTDIKSKTGVTRICKECAKKIAHQSYDDGIEKEPTAESLREALSYLDMPWLYSNYSSALRVLRQKKEAEDYDVDLLGTYISLLHIADKLSFLRFKDSEDMNPTSVINAENSRRESSAEEEIEYNRKDAIKMVGYDPFEDYPVQEDKPLLYAQLVSLIDEETKNDGMKMNAVIQIVKKLNQVEKINKQIDLFVCDTKNSSKNMVIIDKLSASSKKMMDIVKDLAKDNGISVNWNNNKSAGASTLSGKIKKLNEIGLRSAKINSFDVGTCEGMRQVAEISEEARHRRIGYDENIAAEIKDIKVELVEASIKERDEAKEMARKLLLENKDLKDYLREKGLMDDDGRVVDDER